MIWNEKWKGKEFDDIIGNGHKVKELCSDGEIPHLLFYGKPGTGKSMSTEIIIKQLGLNYMKLDASKERGIDTIRGVLRNFAMSASSNGKIKVIWLDEFDGMTNEAYDALRGFMEEFQKTTRIIATCNYIHKIPDAIRSRFTDLEFNNLPMEDIHHNLKAISEHEGVDIDDDLLIILIEKCKFDIRQCISQLEMLHKLNRKIVIGDLKNDTILVEEVHSLLKQKQFPEARQLLLNSNIKTEDFMKDYHEYIMDLSINKNEINPDNTKKIIEKFFEAIGVLKTSACDEIVVEWLLLKIMELI